MPDPRGITTDAGAPEVVAPEFAAGTVIAGRYRLESRLGSGGGGTVWRCFDEKLGAIVAFKIVSAEVDLERWRREVAMARRIAHRNVCRVYDLGEALDVRFVTMELVEGTGLRTRIREDLPADVARDLFRQIVSGTAAIHAAGVVHRDLKPENIVVDTTGRAVIVDFGLAREPRSTGDTVNMRGPTAQGSETVTNMGVVVGTPRYMSPEQSVGDTVDARTDIWALGLIGHELLTGAVPPLDEEGGRRVGNLAKWPAMTPVLRRCLSLLPKERYDDAHALLAALGEPAKPSGRRRIAIAIAAAILATFAALGVRELVVQRSAKTAPAPPGPQPIITTPSDTVRVTQITNSEKEWPLYAPHSGAISPDAKRFAVTTGGGELRVGAIEGGETKSWPLPAIERPGIRDSDPPKQEVLVPVWAVGWYDDNSIGVLGTLKSGEWRLYRLYEDGKQILLHTSTKRFPVAISTSTNTTAIAKTGQAIYFVLPNDQLQQIATIGNGEQVMGLAFSPDGKRIASVRVPADIKEDVTVQVMSSAGTDSRVIWKGQSASIVDEFLVWLDDNRIAFANADPDTRKSRILVHDLRTNESVPRTDWTTDYLGLGTTANGIVLQVRGSANYSVQVGNKSGWPLQQLHAPNTRGRLLAGWTTDGRIVFATGEPGQERIVRGSLANGIEPWPNTTAGVELPDTVIDNDVIAHRLDKEKNEIVVDRIAPNGRHTELVRVPPMAITNYVRCAGDRAAPCFLERIEDDHVTWTELDPATGKLGKLYHRRPLRARHMRSAALSPDGKALAIVEGSNEVHVVSTVDAKLQTVVVQDATALQSLAFASNHDVWMTSIGYRARLFGLAKYGWNERLGRVFDSTLLYVSDKRSQMRWFWRATPSPDMSQVAVVVREFRLEVARIDGL